MLACLVCLYLSKLQPKKLRPHSLAVWEELRMLRLLLAERMHAELGNLSLGSLGCLFERYCVLLLYQLILRRSHFVLAIQSQDLALLAVPQVDAVR